jgi:WD40 repeat protein
MILDKEAFLEKASPYMGLNPYSEADADKFFGRNHDIQRIVNSFLTWRLTVLYGASGVGKSSVLGAGVIPALKEKAKHNIKDYAEPRLAVIMFPPLKSNWQIEPFTNLKAQIKKQIEKEMGSLFFPIEPPNSELSFVEMLKDWTWSLGGEDGWLFIILDQFEEFFQYHPNAESEGGFIAELAKALSQPNLHVNFLISLRKDFFVNLNRLRERIPGILDICLYIDHLNQQEAREAIEKPIKQYNDNLKEKGTSEQPIEIEPKLVDALLKAIPQVKKNKESQDAQGGVYNQLEDQIFAPYLQLIMIRLWREIKNSNSHQLNLQTLISLGDQKLPDEDAQVKSAIENIVKEHVSEKMNDLSSDRQREIAAEIFKYLVTPSGTKYAYSTIDLVKAVNEDKQEMEKRLEETEVKDLLNKLSEGRQRIIQRISSSSDQPDVGRYEIFHDFLVSAILKWRRQYVDKKKIRVKERKRYINIGIGIGFLFLIGCMAWAVNKLDNNKLEKLITQVNQKENIFKNGDQLSALREVVMIDKQAPMNNPLNNKREKLTKEIELILSNFLNEIQEENQTIPENICESDLLFPSPDGQVLAIISSDNKIRLWDLKNKKDLFKHKLELFGKVSSFSFSPDGKTLAIGSQDRTVRILYTQKQNQLKAVKEDPPLSVSGIVSSLSFSADGETLAIGLDNGKIRFRDLKNSKFLDDFQDGMLDSVSSLSFSPDKKILAIGLSNGKIHFWDLKKSKFLDDLQDKVFDSVSSLSFNEKGEFLAIGSTDGRVRIQDWRHPEREPNRFRISDQVLGLSFIPNGDEILATSQANVQRWNWRNKMRLSRNFKESSLVSPPSFSPNGKILAVALGDGTVLLLDGNKLSNLGKPFKASVPVFSFSPDGKALAIALDDGTVKLLDGNNLSNLGKQFKASAPVFSLSFSPDGKALAIALGDGTVKLLDGNNLNNLGKQFNKASAPVFSLSFSPDGKILAVTLGDGTVLLLDGRNLNYLGKQKPFEAPAPVFSLSFSPDGKILAVTLGDGTVKLLDGRNLNDLGKPKPFESSAKVSRLSFSPDSKILAVALGDGTVKLLDGQNLSDLDKFKVSGQVENLSFSSNGKILTAVSIKNKSLLIKTRNIYQSLEEMLDKGGKLLKPYLESHPKQKKESGCS